ncbi:hypothetical protein ABLE91_25645 [Aquabacter sp. CN5-332]|uniref:hypothetical protein n=1 Tax=Aquabacter sp. CN5-332 TaxID=3156608 RepID=UPI0032B40B88
MSQAPVKLPIETINLVGPDTFMGPELAAIWSEVLGRPVAYGGDVSDGIISDACDVECYTKILDRPVHSYRDFAVELASAA